TSFQLTPEGTFCPSCPIRAKVNCGETQIAKGSPKNFGTDCDGFHPIKTPGCEQREMKHGRRQQCPASLTDEVLQYQDMVLLGDTLIGAQFFRGRLDSYRPTPGPSGTRMLLPKKPTLTSVSDARMTPVGVTAVTLAALRGRPDDGGPGVAYLATGSFDRIVAYPLDAAGVLS